MRRVVLLDCSAMILSIFLIAFLNLSIAKKVFRPRFNLELCELSNSPMEGLYSFSWLRPYAHCKSVLHTAINTRSLALDVSTKGWLIEGTEETTDW
jgi:hypothetical protein